MLMNDLFVSVPFQVIKVRFLELPSSKIVTIARSPFGKIREENDSDAACPLLSIDSETQPLSL